MDSRPQLQRDSQVQYLKGVGPRRAEFFAQLGVRTVADLLEYFPRDYEFLPPLCLMGEMNPDQNVTIAGEAIDMRYVGRSRPPRLDLTLRDSTGFCRLTWFHGGYLRDQFLPGDRIAAWGKVSRYKEILQLVNPRWMKVEGVEEIERRQGVGEAVYPASSELTSGEIARVIRESLEYMLEVEEERYRESFLRERYFPTRRQALEWIHRPRDEESIRKARRRLVYDELFLMELGIALRRERLQRTHPVYPLQVDEEIDRRIRRRFPFLLTADQDKVIAEICVDMGRSQPMNRLLQGDVGSGKTVVALYAALLAVGRRKQAAIMAPTEILAEQHFISIERYLRKSQVRRILLTGGLTGGKRAELLRQIRQGEYDIVVGTQALLQQDVEFNNLALVVVDEQHKFGVRQRERIRSKGQGPEGKEVAPHYLVMTATPIPRTLALTVFGDLEVSTIEHLPPGRRAIGTFWYPPEKLPDAYEFIRKNVKQGQQAYFVYPRVAEETSEDFLGDQLKAATAEQETLQAEIFPEFKVSLLHGQMDRELKQQIMDDFRRRKIDILVATIVIEVGIDVPNATIMVIEHAERFGLAQLHQLRGRIGRGKQQSYCLLFGEAGTETAQQRLEIMTQTSDGFRIAEEDLRIRGPGEFFGTAQHGLPKLKIANLLEDMDILQKSRRDAFALAKTDPELKATENQPLRRALVETFGEDLILGDVG